MSCVLSGRSEIDEVGRLEDLMRDHVRRVLSDEGDTTETAVRPVASVGVTNASVPVSEGAGIVETPSTAVWILRTL